MLELGMDTWSSSLYAVSSFIGNDNLLRMKKDGCLVIRQEVTILYHTTEPRISARVVIGVHGSLGNILLNKIHPKKQRKAEMWGITEYSFHVKCCLCAYNIDICIFIGSGVHSFQQILDLRSLWRKKGIKSGPSNSNYRFNVHGLNSISDNILIWIIW